MDKHHIDIYLHITYRLTHNYWRKTCVIAVIFEKANVLYLDILVSIEKRASVDIISITNSFAYADLLLIIFTLTVYKSLMCILFLFIENLEAKMKWLKNFERVQQIQQQIIWQPITELDPRAFIPDVSSAGAPFTKMDQL